MGHESDKKPQLLVNDPVDAATVKRLGELVLRRHQLGELMLDIEAEKVKILVESRQVEAERRKLFANILQARGLSPDAAIEIDSDTGKIHLTPTRQAAPPVEAPPAADTPPA